MTMTEQEKLKDRRHTRIAIILVCVGFIGFGTYLINRNNNVDSSSYRAPVDTRTNYEPDSNVEVPNIVSCPKCGKSYNKNTWGEMCNTCWTEGRGLKSKGEYIIK